MQTKNQTNLTSWDDQIDNKYGKPGTAGCEEWEQEFEAFKPGVLLSEAKVKLKIENDAPGIRLSTLMRIIQKGLGGHLKLTLDL